VLSCPLDHPPRSGSGWEGLFQPRCALLPSRHFEYVRGSHNRWDTEEELRVRKGGRRPPYSRVLIPRATHRIKAGLRAGPEGGRRPREPLLGRDARCAAGVLPEGGGKYLIIQPPIQTLIQLSM
jgi:hypothetical protein